MLPRAIKRLLHQVTIGEHGALYRGTCYRPLSEVARLITGASPSPTELHVVLGRVDRVVAFVAKPLEAAVPHRYQSDVRTAIVSDNKHTGPPHAPAHLRQTLTDTPTG